MQDSPVVRKVIFAAAVFFLAAAGILTRNTSSDDQYTPQSIATSSKPAASPTPGYSIYASRKATGYNLPASATGHLSLASIKVAVPNGWQGIKYLQGTDPEAIRFLARSHAEHTALTYSADPTAPSGTSSPIFSSGETAPPPVQARQPRPSQF